jgi:hypothetical protein
MPSPYFSKLKYWTPPCVWLERRQTTAKELEVRRVTEQQVLKPVLKLVQDCDRRQQQRCQAVIQNGIAVVTDSQRRKGPEQYTISPTTEYKRQGTYWTASWLPFCQIKSTESLGIADAIRKPAAMAE